MLEISTNHKNAEPLTNSNAPTDITQNKEKYRKTVPIETYPSGSANLYNKINQVGEGTFGKVYKAEYMDPLNKTGKPEIVALKKIWMETERDGFPITAMREINILMRLNHKNIIRLREIVTSKPKEKNKYRGNVYLVFDYLEHDFSGWTDMKVSFDVPSIKCIMHQIWNGLLYLHENNILHRDIKSANIWLNNKGEIKIADFGLARIINTSSLKRYTNRVVTLWYRSPEWLLGETEYGPAIDVWSVGCVFSELLTGVSPFRAKKEPEQLEKIFEKLGTPTEETWPGLKKLHSNATWNPRTVYPNTFKSYYKDCKKVDDTAFDLLTKMLTIDPTKRITVIDAMKHPYFTSHLPAMCKPEEIPKIQIESHEFESRKNRNYKNPVIPPQIHQGLQSQASMLAAQYGNYYSYRKSSAKIPEYNPLATTTTTTSTTINNNVGAQIAINGYHYTNNQTENYRRNVANGIINPYYNNPNYPRSFVYYPTATLNELLAKKRALAENKDAMENQDADKRRKND